MYADLDYTHILSLHINIQVPWHWQSLDLNLSLEVQHGLGQSDFQYQIATQTVEHQAVSFFKVGDTLCAYIFLERMHAYIYVSIYCNPWRVWTTINPNNSIFLSIALGKTHKEWGVWHLPGVINPDKFQFLMAAIACGRCHWPQFFSSSPALLPCLNTNQRHLTISTLDSSKFNH